MLAVCPNIDVGNERKRPASRSGYMGHHPDLVREAFGLGDEVKVLFGISFGYEDVSMQVNKAHTERVPLTETVTFRR